MINVATFTFLGHPVDTNYLQYK